MYLTRTFSSLSKKIFGDPEEVNSERYFITLICFIGSVFLMVLAVVHVAMGLVVIPAYISGSAALILMALFPLVRFGKCLFIPKLIITSLAIAGIDLAWYFKFMSLGPVLIFLFAVGALVIWFWDRKTLLIMLFIYFLNLAALAYIEYTTPDFGIEYASMKVRTIDIYFSFTLYFILTLAVLLALKKDFRRQQERAQRAEKLKTAFLANISHEVRTPMNAIYGFSKMLEEETDPRQRVHYINIIQRSSENLLKLINEVVDLSRLEAGYFNLSLKEFSLKAMFSELERIYGKILFDKGRDHIKLEFTLVEHDYILYSDPLRIRQVLSQLIDNAIKHTREGYIRISCRQRRKEVVFSVEDSGTGIREEDQKNIFTRFTKVDMETIPSEGTGIGLALAERIVRMLNGRIWVNSKWGEGTTFYFTLPYIHKDEDPFAKGLTNIIGDPARQISHKMILIVEDDPASYVLITKLLKPFNYTILHAKDGESAIDMVKEYPNLDLVLMDLKLPYLDGYSATKAIKKLKPDLPVIAQTAYAMPGDREKALAAGCDDYISKPLDTKKMLRLLSRYLADRIPGDLGDDFDQEFNK